MSIPIPNLPSYLQNLYDALGAAGCPKEHVLTDYAQREVMTLDPKKFLSLEVFYKELVNNIMKGQWYHRVQRRSYLDLLKEKVPLSKKVYYVVKSSGNRSSETYTIERLLFDAFIFNFLEGPLKTLWDSSTKQDTGGPKPNIATETKGTQSKVQTEGVEPAEAKSALLKNTMQQSHQSSRVLRGATQVIKQEASAIKKEPEVARNIEQQWLEALDTIISLLQDPEFVERIGKLPSELFATKKLFSTRLCNLMGVLTKKKRPYFSRRIQSAFLVCRLCRVFFARSTVAHYPLENFLFPLLANRFPNVSQLRELGAPRQARFEELQKTCSFVDLGDEKSSPTTQLQKQALRVAINRHQPFRFLTKVPQRLKAQMVYEAFAKRLRDLIACMISLQETTALEILIKKEGALAAFEVIKACYYARFINSCEISTLNPIMIAVYQQVHVINNTLFKQDKVDQTNGPYADYDPRAILDFIWGTISREILPLRWGMPKQPENTSNIHTFLQKRQEFFRSIRQDSGLNDVSALERTSKQVVANFGANSKLSEEMLTYLPMYSPAIVAQVLAAPTRSSEGRFAMDVDQALYEQIFKYYRQAFTKFPFCSEISDGFLVLICRAIESNQISLFVKMIPHLRLTGMCSVIQMCFKLCRPDILERLVKERESWHKSIDQTVVCEVIFAQVIQQCFQLNCLGVIIFSDKIKNPDADMQKHLRAVSSRYPNIVLRYLKMRFLSDWAGKSVLCLGGDDVHPRFFACPIESLVQWMPYCLDWLTNPIMRQTGPKSLFTEVMQFVESESPVLYTENSTETKQSALATVVIKKRAVKKEDSLVKEEKF